MKALGLFLILAVGLVSPAFGAEKPCEENARRLYREVTGRAPGQFALSSRTFSPYADAEEYVYLAAIDLGSAYVIRYYHLDGRSCFLQSMRFDGDL